MVEKTAGSQDPVRACAAEIRVLLPKLADRHSPLVVLAALTEHVGGALNICQETGACTPQQARAVLHRLEQIAFPDDKPS